MQNTTRRGLLRTAVVALAGALALASGAGAAHAADPSPVIDPAAKGSITIHKFDHPTTALPHDGTEVTTGLEGFSPINDVEFTVQQVLGENGAYDLTTNAGWTALESLTPEIAKNGPFGSSTTITTGTDVDGVAVAGNLPVGVYLVTETKPPVGAAPVAPFLVTVPIMNPTTKSAWLYDVHVYPKNSIVGATKTVDDEPTTLFHNVVWTILADIPDTPVVDDSVVIDGYKIVDPLDSRLTYTSTAVSLTAGPALTGADYTVSFDSAHNTVTVLFTEKGREALAANHDAQVKVEITTKANTTAEIPNTAIVYPNLPSFSIEPGQPGGPTKTPPVETKWGSVSIHKVVKESKQNLSGATFGLYLNETDALKADAQKAVKIGTTGADGMLRFEGLRYSDFADGKDVVEGEAGYQAYWIAELQAPAGYEPLTKPIKVIVGAPGTAPATYTVENAPRQNVIHLPLTGGSGAAMLTVAGALVVAGTLLIASRRRTTAQA
ncbi:SpaH/EbpB family LPXTG-anchored major pilin [Xylanimonas ulmi]|uniref:LPXTG-motif cell wall-anchored protein/fimbrial isopeptide formation D2 family protein n=1 Tax=Xylanimonas ulmi TaxID=228973 RepID=A0A4Q7M4W4_9MICO|nr:SpaH/EbpB family LPXTG-anchored major pilin [Xylanibacterium ulmi]RZS62654.1 LPXTG-motif cell wall-anchored protein/fimbrial isopeptide formation D2 family protein [Xylanibacterium ulmi]